MADIKLVDVSIRDGNQSLWGATGLNTRQILQIAGAMNRIGLHACDFTSSTTMAVAIRYAADNPWERIKRMVAAMPHVPLQFITTGFRFVAWQLADPEFMRLAYRRLQMAGIGRFSLLDPMHDVESVLSSARMIKQEGNADVMGGLTFTISDLHTDDFYEDFARKIGACADVDRFYIKDPSGLLSPERVRTLAPRVKQALAGKPLEIHSHCTVGYGAMTSLAAADLNIIDAIHVGIGPLGDGSSLPEAVNMVKNLREAGHTVAIDDDALQFVSDYWYRLAKAESLPMGSPQRFDAGFLRHQLAGGVMTTLKRQLEELGLVDRLDEVIEETERVRAELGQPIMVTPFPQMVMSQALFNVLGTQRYAQVSDQVLRYVLGKFGKPTVPIAEEIRAVILDRPKTKEILGEADFPEFGELKRKFGEHMDDEEFLFRAVMPQEQVDQVYGVARSGQHYNPELAPLKQLLKQLADNPESPSIAVERPGFRLQLHKGAGLEKLS